ncbi:MAG: diaminopimelate epimerase [Phycisphaeraceae bacterium]|nr:diaminopimelate epimerase [Phycisphaeraceae bacterium]
MPHQSLAFVKMHGIANDYVYLDAVTDPSIESEFAGPAGAALVRAMSDRHTGVGSDGVILLCRPTPSESADVRMRMFNSDGSESQMCGNGVRCVAKFAHDRLGVRASPMRVQTGRGVLLIDYRCENDRLVEATVDMGEPILDPALVPVVFPRPEPIQHIVGFPIARYIPWPTAPWMEAAGLSPAMTCVSMGNPHVVIFCENPDAVPLETVGPYLETQPIFPERINVHFARVISPREAAMRTWERGAGITLACGTGACAVAVAGVLSLRLHTESLIHLPGGDLRIRWDTVSRHVFKSGPAADVFEGVWPLQPPHAEPPGAQPAPPHRVGNPAPLR